jgi:hypothetical protein
MNDHRVVEVPAGDGLAIGTTPTGWGKDEANGRFAFECGRILFDFGPIVAVRERACSTRDRPKIRVLFEKAPAEGTSLVPNVTEAIDPFSRR